MKQHTLKHVIPWILVMLYITWIFSNSFASGTVSGAESSLVANWILSLFMKVGISIPFEAFHFYIRKAAHFLEYALLGFLCFWAARKKFLWKGTVPTVILIGCTIPLCDEGIQMFSPGRTPAFLDCLIDMSGYLCGAMFFTLLLWISHCITK